MFFLDYIIFYSNYLLIFLLILLIILLFLISKKREKIPQFIIDFETLKDERFLELFVKDLFYFKIIMSKIDYQKFEEYIKNLTGEERENFIFYLKEIEKKNKNKFLKLVNKNIEDLIFKGKKKKIIISDQKLKEKLEESNIQFFYFPEIVKIFKTKLKEGDVIKIKILKKGRYFDEGIGFLPDDTPVIVKEGANYLGEEVTCVIEKVKNTYAGTILEAKIFKGNT
ncbi:MAG: TRAM domain-containing protein [candidate division WOR-3 bacterium]